MDTREARSVDTGQPLRTQARRRKVASKVVKPDLVVKGSSATDSATMAMDAKEFERFEKCMKNPKKPSKTMVEGAKLHRLLVSNS